MTVENESPDTLLDNSPADETAEESNNDNVNTTEGEVEGRASSKIDPSVNPDNQDIRNEVPQKFLNEDGEVDIDKLNKSYLALEKRLGAPPEVPNDPSEYEYDFGDVEVNQEEADQFKQAAHEMGITKQQYQWLMDTYKGMVEQGQYSNIEASTESLKEAWGDSFDQNLNAANKAIAEYSPEGVDIRDYPHLANDPVFAQIMAKIGSELSGDSAPSPTDSIGGGYTKLDIQKMMADSDFGYNKEKQRIVSDWYKRNVK